MNPLIAAIPGTTKPTLVTTKHFLMESGRVHGLIQTKELRAGINAGCIGVRRIGNRRPGAGELIGLFQRPSAVPSDDQATVG